MHPTSLLLLLILSACASQRASTVDVETSSAKPTRGIEVRDGPLFPTPKRGLTLRPDANGRVSLAKVLDEFMLSTGQGVMINEDARERLKQTWHDIPSEVAVPPAEVYPFVEAILDHHDFVLIEAKHDEPRLLGLHPRSSGKRLSLLSDAIPVSVDSMHECARHPAVLVQTMVDVSPLNANEISQQLRYLTDDRKIELIQAVGEDGQVLVIGRGKRVADWVSLMRESASVALAARPKRDRERRAPEPRVDPSGSARVQIAQELE